MFIIIILSCHLNIAVLQNWKFPIFLLQVDLVKKIVYHLSAEI